jgi:hypothetical protein
MKKLIIITGLCLLALIVTLVGCTQTTGAEGPRINSISAQLSSTQQTTTSNQTTTDNETMQEEMMNVRVQVSVANFEVVSAIGETSNMTEIQGQTQGYFIYYMDSLPSSLSDQIPQMQTDQTDNQTKAFSSTQTSLTWDKVAPGIHIFAVQLVDKNGESLSPPVAAAAALTVPASS